ncbi:hypothetical protein ROJ8625_03861 [Roseivivax jejudonensis]|uniref:Tetratricopeptide repeat protein n=1 Tax=Roseivivax jejudonensis TaxID=1529041 RepID=A0A1X7AA48_9RHOB|nr:hypothetical protein [Roseivivax jejudonensis]SLN72644.1 hypothetical protein ROJ8625_03861 [Roseivivax jejudonensis]
MATTPHHPDRPRIGGTDAARRIDDGFINRQAWAIRWQDRAQSVEMAFEVFRLVESGLSYGLAHRTLAWQALWRGDLGAAADHGALALDMLAGGGTRGAVAIADVHSVFARLYAIRGRRDLSRVALEDGFAALGGANAPGTRAALLCAQACVQRLGRHFDEARESLRLAMVLGEAQDSVALHGELSCLEEADGNNDAAMSHAMRAVTSAQASRNRVLLPYAMTALARGHRLRGGRDRARAYLAEARVVAEADDDPQALSLVFLHMADIEIDDGQPRAALRAVETGLRHARGLGHVLLEHRLLRRAADLHEVLDDAAAALQAYKRLVTLLEAERE